MNEGDAGAEYVDVTTSLGTLRGAREDGLSVFRGVRYAKAPVGELRFRPPVPEAPWDGVRDALEYAPSCPQLTAGPDLGGGGAGPQDEDCLALNIWTPSNDDARRPVMVWIHGGAFVAGSGSSALYTGESFADKDVVFVSLNYRLHVLGFLDLESAGAEFVGSANSGMLDVVTSLEWVRDHIADFGGDPGNVTIFGESAGAAVVGALLAMPAASGLFHRAICESGTGHHTRAKAVAERATAQLYRAVGVTEGDVAALQALPIDSIVKTVADYGVMVPADVRDEIFGEDDPLNAMPFRFTHGDSVIPRPPMEAIEAGSAAAVDLIVGANDDEFRLFYLGGGGSPTDAGMMSLELHAERLDTTVEEILRTYRQADPDMSDDDICIAMASDIWFILAGRELAQVQSRQNPRTFRYAFSWRSPVFGGVLGAAHALEIPFVFNHLAEARLLVGADAPQHLADAMQEAWVRFARTGDPGWPAWTSDERHVMRFDDAPQVVDDPEAFRVSLWTPKFPALV